MRTICYEMLRLNDQRATNSCGFLKNAQFMLYFLLQLWTFQVSENRKRLFLFFNLSAVVLSFFAAVQCAGLTALLLMQGRGFTSLLKRLLHNWLDSHERRTSNLSSVRRSSSACGYRESEMCVE